MEDLNDIIEDEEKAEKLSKIIEEKVEEKLKKQRERNRTNEKTGEKQISRRSFLKKLGAGAAGLGALSLLPSVSAFDVKSSDGLEVFDGTDTKYLDVNPGGPVEVKNTDLQIKGNTAWHAGNDGSGSGLNADQVDGKDASTLAKLYEGVQAPVYTSLSDVPDTITKGEIIFNDADGSLYVEDGT